MKRLWHFLPLLFKLFSCKDERYELIATYGDAKNKISFYRFYETTIGGVHSAIVLKFNNRLVDYYGSLPGIEKGYERAFPKQAKHIQRIEYIFSTDYDTLPEGSSGWCIWVNPKQFTKTQYDLICRSIQENKSALLYSLNNKGWFNTPYQLYIDKIAYFNYEELQKDVFSGEEDNERYILEIFPQGVVTIEVEDKQIHHIIGAAIGSLDSSGTKILLQPHWKIEELPALEIIRQLKDSNGRRLDEVFEIVELSNE